jgi:hypothetical protein
MISLHSATHSSQMKMPPGPPIKVKACSCDFVQNEQCATSRWRSRCFGMEGILCAFDTGSSCSVAPRSLPQSCQQGAESRPPERCGQPRPAHASRYCPGGGPRQGWRGAEWSATQWSGAPHAVLGLDGVPPGSRVRVSRGVGGRATSGPTRARSAPREAQSGHSARWAIHSPLARPLFLHFRRAREALTPSARADLEGRGGNHGPLM